jgi:hypothetical protein
MEKIILALDAAQVNNNMLDFACYIARLTHSRLTGIFLENLLLEDVSVIHELAGVAGGRQAAPVKEAEEKAKRIMEQVHFFKEACSNRGVNCEVRIERNMPSNVIITESRFADLVILDAATSFEKQLEGVPTRFVKEVLASAECPVLVAPAGFEGIDEIILAYDGSASSVFAIKQFNYLFPQFSDKRIIAVQVNDRSDIPVAQKERIGEWLKVHYSGIGYHVIEGKPDEELFKYLLGRKRSLVVMGAFGRSMLSALLKCSTAELIMKVVNLPIFITHH